MRHPLLAAFASLALISTACLPAAAQTISTVAGGAVNNVAAASVGFYDLTAATYDQNGNLLIADCTRIYRVNSAGNLTTVAGNGAGCNLGYPGDPGDNGPATAASLNGVLGMAVDSSGNIYLSDSASNEVRKINASTGIVTAIAGNGSAGFSGDGGPAAQALLNDPWGLALDAAGNLFVSDMGNGRVREIAAATGNISTVAQISGAQRLALDGIGHLYVGAGTVVKQITLAGGAVAVVAGGGTLVPAGGVAATTAKLYLIRGLTTDAAGNLYFAAAARSNGPDEVFEIAAGSPNLALLAGGGTSFSPTGPATSSEFGNVSVLLPNLAGGLLLANNGGTPSKYLLALASDGTLSVVAGNGTTGPYSALGQPALSSLVAPSNLDASSSLVFADSGADQIQMVSGGVITAIAGKGQAGYTGDGGPATQAELSRPAAVVRDKAGNLFIADTGNNVVREVSATTGIISTVAGNGTGGDGGDGSLATQAALNATAVTVDAQGNLWILDSSDGVVRKVTAATGVITTVAGNGNGYNADSGDGGPATSAGLDQSAAIALDASGNLFIADDGSLESLAPGSQTVYLPSVDGAIRRVDATTGIITTVAGLGAANTHPIGFGDGGLATAAALSDPYGLAVDRAGNLYVAGFGSARVREVIAATGIIQTLAGNGKGGVSGDGGPATSAELRPCGLSFDPSGNLDIADCDVGRIRVVSDGMGLPTLSPTSLTFAPQPVSTKSAIQMVTVTNPGLAPLAITAIAASGDYAETNTCGTTLAAAASCTVSVTFTPTAGGVQSGSVTVGTNLSATPITAALSGTGGLPAATLSPTALNFAGQGAGSTSTPQAVTLTDSGGAPLSLGAISVSGAFTQTNTCGATLAIGASCSIAVSFAPTTAGAGSGALTIADNAANSPQSVALAGNAVLLPVLSQTIRTIAGGAPVVGATYKATSISLQDLVAVTGDAAGNLYLADNGSYVTAIFKLTPDGNLGIYAGNGSNGYSGDGGPATQAQIDVANSGDAAGHNIAVDSAGNLYFADPAHNVVREVAAATGIITTVAGTGTAGFSGNGGAATGAQLNTPAAVATDAAGNLYIADSQNGAVRRVDAATHQISTVAGLLSGATTLYPSGAANPAGAATSVALGVLEGMGLDGQGNIFVLDVTNHVVWRVDASSGAISITAGQLGGSHAVCAGAADSSGDACPATQAALGTISVGALSVDQGGDVFVADRGPTGAGAAIREVVAGTQTIQLVAGSLSATAGLANAGAIGDGGSALSALLLYPTGLYASPDGSLAIADANQARLRWISGGQISTRAGNGFYTYAGDGGPALNAQFESPNGIALDAQGDLLIAGNAEIRQLSPPNAGGTQTITTIVGTGAVGPLAAEGTPALNAQVNNVYGIVSDAAGDIIYADTGNNAIRMISASSGKVTTLAGGLGAGFTGDGGPASNAAIDTPRLLALDAAGNLYFGSRINFRIREITTAGIIQTVVGNGTQGYTGDGGPATSAEIGVPSGIAFDAAGNMFFADTGNHVIREVVKATGIIQTVVGNGTAGLTGMGGPATAAEISYPYPIVLDAAGNLFIGDESNGVVLEEKHSTGILNVIGGLGTQTAPQFSGAAGSDGALDPAGMVMDAQGNLFVGDLNWGTVVEIATQPAATLSAAALAFGNQALGSSSASQSVTLTNGGGDVLTLANIAVSGANAADFTTSNNCGASLAVGALCSIQVTFAPGAAGARAASLVLSDNASGSPQMVTLSGTGVAAVATLSPTSLSFGGQALGSSSAAQNVTLTNSGGASLTIAAIASNGAFAQTNTCGLTLAPGASCVIAVTFTPTAVGTNSGALSLSDNAGGSPQSVALAGTGVALPQVQLSTAALAFASQALNTPSGAQNVVVTNTGTVAAAIAGVAATGDFAASSACPATLLPTDQCVVAVTFTPSLLGARLGTLSVNDNATGSPQQVALSGSGIGAGVALAPSSLNFGSQPVGSTGGPLALVVSNTSSAALNISAATASAGFALAGSCPTVPAGGSCSFGVTFTPLGIGAVSGTLTLTDNAGGGTQSVPLAGIGTAAGVLLAPANLDFGGLVVGAPSFAQQVTVSNSGNAPLNGLAIPAQAGDFAVLNAGGSPCASTLAAGASCSFAVTLTPSAAGADNATLAISDSLGTQAVALAGLGLAPGVSLSSLRVSFGSQTVNTPSGAQTVSLANTGAAALTITSLTPNSSAFAENDNCVGSLAAGAHCSINITFTPAAAGAALAVLTIADSAGGHSIALAGSGVVGMALAPSGLDFGAQELGGVSPQQTVNVTNTGVTVLSLTNFTASGDFQLAQNLCASPLLPGASCPVFVTYTPSSLGSSQGSLTLADSGNVTSASIVLTGTGTRPGISASPATLAFGGATVGATAQQQTVTISNNGSATLNLQSLAAQGDFVVSASTCLSASGGAQALAPGASCIVSVTMTPTSLGTRTGALVVYNDADGSLSLALTGTGQGAGVGVAPTQLAFGSQPVPGSAGQVSLAPVPQTITITNNGTAALGFSSFAISGGFSQTNNCGAGLAPAASCTVSVAFHPTAQGQWTGTLTINDNASTGSPQLVTLNGFGSPNGLTLSPAVLSFGGLAVGAISSPELATLNNGTGQTIVNLSIAASGLFHQVNTCPATLAAGANCTITLTVTPTIRGYLNGAVSINGALGGSALDPARAAAIARAQANPGVTSSALNLAQIAVSSNGDPAALSLSAASLAFASQAVGSASASQTVTITNASTATAVTGLAITSTPDFPVTSSCAATLAPGANCTFAVTFQPVAAGVRSGSLSIAAAGGLQSSLALGGTATGGILAVSPSTLAFGARAEGTASAPQTVTVSNPGSASFALQSLTSSNADFTVAASTCGALPATLAANASCNLSLVFVPSTIAAESGTLTIASNASNGSAVVGLSGSGSPQGLTLSPNSLNFGNQGVGLASAARTVILANPGTAAVAISAITAGGDFTQSNNCGAALAAGASCAVQVAFTPTAAGARSATLTVTDADAVQTAALSGDGTAFTLAAALPSQNVVAGGTAQFQVLLTPGAFAGAVSLACSGAPAAATCSIAPAALTLAPGINATATVTVTTTSRALLPPFAPPASTPRPGPLAWYLLAGAGLALLLLATARRRRLLLVVGAAALLAGACGGVSNTPNAGNGTPGGTYTLTITATAGAATQSTQVTLGVN